MTSYPAFFLVGPTASGKSAVAQHLAERLPSDILSADSMLVYRGMNVGTDKPGPASRGHVRYGGIDLVEPDESFSIGRYLHAARSFLMDARDANRTVIVAGGTGLYLKGLTRGLDDLPEARSELRAEMEALLRNEGVESLQRRLQEISPADYKAMPDPANPRRLIRAVALAEAGARRRDRWAEHPPDILVGLNWEREALYIRIEQRVHKIYEQGLLEEIKQLKKQYESLSSSALQAIGYKEGMAVLSGRMSADAAIRVTIQRTRRLAKKQLTWFRHQERVSWVDVDPDMSTADMADAVQDRWREHGAVPIIL